MRIIGAGYHYRDTFAGSDYERGHNTPTRLLRQTLRSDRHPTDLVSLADAFSAPRRGIAFGHRDGYNFVRLDASGHFYADAGQEIDRLRNGAPFNEKPYLIEQAFESLRWGELVGRGLYKP